VRRAARGSLLFHAERLVSALDRLGISYAVCGALAVNAWVAADQVRTTKDLDIIAPLPDETLQALLAGLARRAVRAVHASDLELPRTGTKIRRVLAEKDIVIDFIDVGPRFSAAIVARSVATRIGRAPARVASAEDLVLLKALAGRDQDWIDIARLIESRGGELDRRYLERQARKLGLWTRVRRALARRARA
jgi:hypothetical protein